MHLYVGPGMKETLILYLLQGKYFPASLTKGSISYSYSDSLITTE